MKIIDFNLGQNAKTGDLQWQFTEEKNGFTTMYVVDHHSSLRPEEGRTRFVVSEADKVVFQSENGRFRIRSVTCVTALPQVRSKEECVEVKESEKLFHDGENHRTASSGLPLQSAPTRSKRQKVRRYVDLPPDGKKAKLPGRPRDRKLSKGGDKNKNKKKGRAV